MIIEESSLMPSSSKTSWTATSFDCKMTQIAEDRMRYELTDESLRSELQKEM